MGTSSFYGKVGTSIDVPTFFSFRKGGDVATVSFAAASESLAPLPPSVQDYRIPDPGREIG